MPKILITRKIPNRGVAMLTARGYEVIVSPHDRVLSKEELVSILRDGQYDAVLCLLTDKIDGEIFDAAGKQCKIFANYAVGFDNIDLAAASERGIQVTNTPDVLTETVAEFAFGLILAVARRIVESDSFARAGKYHGWEPELLLGDDVSHKTLGVVGLGRIGSRVAYHAARGFDMRVLYYDIQRNENFEREVAAEFRANADDVFKEADFVSIHVPLLPTTRHMVNADRLKMMKPTAYLVNTSRGPIVDEGALRDALKARTIKGAAIDVWEHEPELTPGLADLSNIVITPHTASATEEARQKMGEVAAKNIIEALEGRMPPNLVEG